uniref:Coiled-coil domain-containing protein 22 homolog n=1 Tax=Lygus hesperus TaxID=30085 RepID=A0A0K8SMG4_LYGHE
MAARFQVGACIANACKDLGYSGDVGYQTFLYSNVTDLRRVFIFLIEKLPRESDRAAEPEPDDPLSRLKADIGRSVRASLNSRLTLKDIVSSPFISFPLETGIIVPRDKLHLPRQEWTDYCINSLKFLPDQVPPEYLLPSTIALNARGCVARSIRKGGSKASTPEDLPLPATPPTPAPRTTKRQTTWLGQQEKILFERDIVVPQSLNKEKLVIPEINASEEGVDKEEKQRQELEALKSHIEELQTAIRNDTSELAQVRKDYESVEAELKGRVKEYEALCKALELLPNYEDNLKKVEGLITLSDKRFESLNAQWDSYKKPLTAKYEELKSKARTNDNDENSETVSALRSKLDVATKQILAKQQQMQQLQKEFDQLPKNIIRSSYTRRIMEIIGNIKKQKDEIDKILRDTKQLQRNTNGLFGTLDRLFTVVDETIFRNAKKDEHSKKAYKHLATLHTDCADIVRMVMETGAIEREIRDLQEQVENESSKKVGDNLERISADMRLLKEENVTLTRQLKL